jgi:hypothetical protein
LRETSRRRERRVAVAGRNVEDTLIAAQIDGFAEHLADDLQCRADDRVVAGGPRDLLSRLDGREVDGGGGRHLNVHRSDPCFF